MNSARAVRISGDGGQEGILPPKKVAGVGLLPALRCEEERASGGSPEAPAEERPDADAAEEEQARAAVRTTERSGMGCSS